jgi:tetratricopeptide (TPR) repeat protein
LKIKPFLSSALISILVATIVLGATEVILKLTANSLDNPLAHEITVSGEEFFQINRGYLKKYFSPNAAIIPELKPTIFYKHKRAGAFRILCLGESSMFGTPYQMTCTIPAIVRKQLRHLFPGREIEVINLAASAINSNVALDLAKRIEPFQADLVLLYLGHNEFYGPDGVGASFLQRHIPSTIPWVYGLRDMRMVSFVTNLLRKAPGHDTPDAEQNLMRQVSDANRVGLYSASAERTFDLFEQNLSGICGVLRSAGVPVIVSDVTSNPEFPPFDADSTSLPGAATGLARDFEAVLRTGEYGLFLNKLNTLMRADTSIASLHYWKGRALLAMGKRSEAERELAAARDYDMLKFRAPARTNGIIHRVCETTATPCIFTDSLFAMLRRSGTTANELFWEHVHPTPRGYYEIASLFVRKIVDMKLLSPSRGGLSPARLLPFEGDSLGICWLELAYGDLSIQRLTGMWPFNNYKRSPLVIDRAPAELKRIAQQTYARSLGWEEGCYASAVWFWQANNLREAQTTYEALADDNAQNYYAEYLLGNILVRQGDAAGGASHYRKSIAINPGYPNPKVDLALLDINAGKYAEAITELKSALALAAGNNAAGLRPNIYYGLSAAYANKQEYDSALTNVDEALRLDPTYGDAQKLRGAILAQRRK